MKRHWFQIAKLPVHLENEESNLGVINGVFIHPDNGQIIAFLVGFMKVLVPIDVRKWTHHGVEITEPEALVPPAEIHRLESVGYRRAFFNGKVVKSKSGYRYGRVRDFEMDFSTNHLLTFEVSKKLFWLEWGSRLFRAQDIDHITDRTVVVTLEPVEVEPIKLKRPQQVARVS